MTKLFKIALLLLVLCTSGLYCQDNRPTKNKPANKKKTFFEKDSIYYGGNLGLQWTGYGTMIDISPNVGYKFNKFISVGLQSIFTNISYNKGGFKYNYLFYGGGTFVRIKPINFLFLQAEYDILDVPDNFSIAGAKRTIADVNLAGLGLRNQMGQNACYYILFMYEFAPTPNSPYTYGPFGPLVYRAGFNINF